MNPCWPRSYLYVTDQCVASRGYIDEYVYYFVVSSSIADYKTGDQAVEDLIEEVRSHMSIMFKICEAVALLDMVSRHRRDNCRIWLRQSRSPLLHTL
jgi:hypothetical protein